MCFQVRAIKVIFLIWTNPKKGLAKKRILQRDATEGETYYEAIPTTAIFMFIAIYSMLQESKNMEIESPLLALVGSDGNIFLVTFATSLLTASLGLSKALKTGPCRVFPEGGMLSGRFLLLVCANLVTLLGKIALISSTAMVLVDSNSGAWTYYVSVLLVSLPGLIIGLISTWHSRMLKTFFNHPSFFILPIFTCFTFSSSKKTSCCTRDGGPEGHIRFSVNASLCNLFASVLTSVVFVVTSVLVTLIPAGDDFGIVIFVFNFFFSFIGLLLNLLFVCNARPTNDRFSCCYCCRSCCCSCCSCNAVIEYGIYKPYQPTKHFILRIDADGSEEVLLEEQMEMEQTLGHGDEEILQQGEQGEEEET